MIPLTFVRSLVYQHEQQLQHQQQLQQQQQLHQHLQQQQQHPLPQPHPQGIPPQPSQHHQPPPQQQPGHLGANGQPMVIPSAGTPNIGIRGMPPAHPSSSTAIPPHGSNVNAPPIESTLAETPAQKENLIQYQERDKTYQKILDVQHKRHVELAQEKKREIEVSTIERRTRTQGANGLVATFGPGYQGYGNGSTGFQSRIIYPREKKRLRRTPLLKL